MFTLVFSIIIFLLAVAAIFLVFKPFTVDNNPKTKTPVRIIAFIIAAVLVIILAFMSVASVGKTAVGVPITLGKPGAPLGPGPHLVLPWTSVEQMDVKTQVLNLDNDAEVKTITSDRIQVPVDASVYFSVDKVKAPTLLLTVGKDYINKVIVPLSRSTIYDQGAKFSSEDIQNQRDNYETAVENTLRPVLAARGIVLEKVELRKFQIPENILNNAQAKINAEETQKRAKIDAETAKIEAQGKAAANKILSDSINKNPAIICYNFVEGMRDGKITGPFYVTPCGGSGQTPNLLVQTKD